MSHRVTRPGCEWALWRWVAVRGAGFEVSQPSRLAAVGSARLADAVIDLDGQVERSRAAALVRLQRDLDTRVGDGRALVRARNRVRTRDYPSALAAAGTADDLQALQARHEQLMTARHAYRQAFDRETGLISDALCQIASDDRFREAVLWQNRRAVHNGLASFVRRHRRGDSRDSRQRQNEELIASYLQRYCLKNDTIGFFGPVGWATMAADGPALVVRPGGTLLASRHVYFETWCIEAVAEALTRDHRLERWLVAMRTFAGQCAYAQLLAEPAGSSRTLTACEAALLEACDGVQTVEQIAGALMRDRGLGVNSEQEVLEQLRAFRQRDLISLTLPIPMDLHPERALETQLQRVSDVNARAQALRALQDLQDARARVIGAAGASTELDGALEALDERFTTLTGRAPTRSAGKTYAARTLVFEDCRRDAEIALGPELVDALLPPLALVLTSVRWLTFDTAQRYLAAFRPLYQELARHAHPAPISLPSFLDKAFPLLFGDAATLVLDSLAILHQRWIDLLDLSWDAPAVHYESRDLERCVRSAFDAPGPGWPFARYHSPDVLLVARSEEQVRRGDFLFVLGELHAASNTMGWAGFVAQHPCPDALVRAVDLDVPERRLEPIVPKRSWPGQAARLLPSLISPKDFRLALSEEPSTAPGARVLPASAFVLCGAGNRLFVRTRDGRHEFDLLAVVAQALTWRTMRAFRFLPARPHTPRVTFDRLVVTRESWCIPITGIRFAELEDEGERFLAARRWAREQGLPCQVFVKAPVEPKPFYVDFASPIYVTILAKAIRRSRDAGADAVLVVTEMLPRAEDAWLTDAEGTRYSSELRMVAVDLLAPSAEGGR